MEILKPQPTSKAPSDWFTGDVWWDVIYAGQEPSRMRANMVRFATVRANRLALPCSRTDPPHRLRYRAGSSSRRRDRRSPPG